MAFVGDCVRRRQTVRRDGALHRARRPRSRANSESARTRLQALHSNSYRKHPTRHLLPTCPAMQVASGKRRGQNDVSHARIQNARERKLRYSEVNTQTSYNQDVKKNTSFHFDIWFAWLAAANLRASQQPAMTQFGSCFHARCLRQSATTPPRILPAAVRRKSDAARLTITAGTALMPLRYKSVPVRAHPPHTNPTIISREHAARQSHLAGKSNQHIVRADISPSVK